MNERKSRLKGMRRNQEGGFTIVEFLIATGVFSLVLLLCAMAIVHIGKMYYKGVITNRTQDTARRVVEDIAAAIQFGPGGDVSELLQTGTPVTEGGITRQSYCIGNSRYTYTTNAALGTSAGMSRHVLWKDRTTGGCDTMPIITSANPGGINAQEMLGDNMRLPYFCISRSGELWTVSIRVAYGSDTSLFAAGSPTQCNGVDVTGSNLAVCKGTNAGGQFCAVSEFETKVIKRLN